MAFNSLICTYLDFHFDSQNSEFVVLTYFPKSPRGLFCELTLRLREIPNGYQPLWSPKIIISKPFLDPRSFLGTFTKPRTFLESEEKPICLWGRGTDYSWKSLYNVPLLWSGHWIEYLPLYFYVFKIFQVQFINATSSLHVNVIKILIIYCYYN